MIKKKTILVNVCDICGDESRGACMFCGRELCNEHNYVSELWIRRVDLNETRPVVCEDCAGGATLKNFLDKISEKKEQKG